MQCLQTHACTRTYFEPNRPHSNLPSVSSQSTSEFRLSDPITHSSHVYSITSHTPYPQRMHTRTAPHPTTLNTPSLKLRLGPTPPPFPTPTPLTGPTTNFRYRPPTTTALFAFMAHYLTATCRSASTLFAIPPPRPLPLPYSNYRTPCIHARRGN